jgi:hypothetical protein
MIVFTILSGLGDAQGFIHASKIWDNGKLILKEVGKSSLGYAIGIILFWIALRFLNELGVTSSGMQTIIWFAATIIGVALIGGDFYRWSTIDKGLSIVVVALMGLLMYRTGS